MIQMDMILETSNLTKKFKKQTAVERLSIGIERNSVYGLLGPNGAGKSTTLKMITGMQKPSSGSIKFEGHEWRREDLSGTEVSLSGRREVAAVCIIVTIVSFVVYGLWACHWDGTCGSE